MPLLGGLGSAVGWVWHLGGGDKPKSLRLLQSLKGAKRSWRQEKAPGAIEFQQR